MQIIDRGHIGMHRNTQASSSLFFEENLIFTDLFCLWCGIVLGWMAFKHVRCAFKGNVALSKSAIFRPIY